eukprot:m.148059 g.148059  ORF g.148059 m.148059 type:complete len:302 (+) comp17304_c0_seq4:554-1459(+)
MGPQPPAPYHPLPCNTLHVTARALFSFLIGSFTPEGLPSQQLAQPCLMQFCVRLAVRKHMVCVRILYSSSTTTLPRGRATGAQYLTHWHRSTAPWSPTTALPSRIFTPLSALVSVLTSTKRHCTARARTCQPTCVSAWTLPNPAGRGQTVPSALGSRVSPCATLSSTQTSSCREGLPMILRARVLGTTLKCRTNTLWCQTTTIFGSNTCLCLPSASLTGRRLQAGFHATSFWSWCCCMPSSSWQWPWYDRPGGSVGYGRGEEAQHRAMAPATTVVVYVDCTAQVEALGCTWKTCRLSCLVR